MGTPIHELSDWMVAQLAAAPGAITAVYIEWTHSYSEVNTARESVWISLAAFGFENLSVGAFDCANPDDLVKLGDFTWEGPHGLDLRDSDYPGTDWTKALQEAAALPAVRTLVRGRNLLLLLGYHDDDVFDAS